MSDSRIYFDPPVTEGAAFVAQRGSKTKAYLEKVAKLVPVEIVAPYKGAMLLVPSLQPAGVQVWFAWALFALGVAGTLWYVGWRMGKRFVKQRHLLVYGAAFLVWAYAVTGEQLLAAPYYQPPAAGIFLIVASAVLGRIKLPARERKTAKKS